MLKNKLQKDTLRLVIKHCTQCAHCSTSPS